MAIYAALSGWGDGMAKKLSGVTSPFVAATILFITARFGMRWPVLKRYSVTRETPIRRANSLSGVLESEIHVLNFMSH